MSKSRVWDAVSPLSPDSLMMNGFHSAYGVVGKDRPYVLRSSFNVDRY